MIANAQSKSVPARPTAIPTLSHTYFLCRRTGMISLRKVKALID